MPHLILIKHAKPEVDPREPSDRWSLSDAGRASCKPLAERLAPHEPTRIVTSDEPKAIETGKLVAAALSIPCGSAPDLHEHDRSNVPHLRTGEFISLIELFFRKPNELVLGRETADVALARFARALDAQRAAHPAETLAVVTHGTVLALYLAPVLNRKPFDLWRALGLPSVVVLDWPSETIVDLIERV